MGVAVVLVLAVGLAVGAVLVTRSDSSTNEATVRDDDLPLAVVSRITSAAEVPPTDLYLVELGQPLEDGLLLKKDVHHVESAALPDGRVLVTYQQLDLDGEQVTGVGAVVADRGAGTVEPVLDAPNTGGAGYESSPSWEEDDQLLQIGSGCQEWSLETGGSGFQRIECPERIVTPPPADAEQGRAWRHDASGAIYVLRYGTIERRPRSIDEPPPTHTISRLEPRGGTVEMLVSGERVDLLDVSEDGTTALVVAETGCEQPRPRLCDLVLAANREGRLVELAAAPAVRTAFVLPDGQTVVASLRRSLTQYPYPEESFLTTIVDPQERTPLYDGTVEAILGTDSGLVELDRCPPEVPCR